MSNEPAVADLRADTAVEPRGAGAYRLALPDHWNFLIPSGGVAMTAALRVAEAELADPGFRLVSATTTFCAPINAGAVDGTAVILRRGGSTAQVRVGLANAGQVGAGLELTATFCRDRRGPDVIGARFPEVPMPDDSVGVVDESPSNPHARLRFFQQLDCRIARGDAFWRPGWAAGRARYARWFRYRVPQRDGAGHFDRLAHAPIADTMPAALAQAIGPSPYRYYAPSLDLTLHVVDDTAREWLLVSTWLRRARAGWAIAEAEIWDDERRLLAFATQAMYVSTIAGEPPTVDAGAREPTR